MDLVSLKRALIVLKFFCLPIVGNRLTYVVKFMGWKRTLPLEIYNNFKTWISIMIFLCVKLCDINYRPVKITPISHLYYIYAKLLT